VKHKVINRRTGCSFFLAILALALVLLAYKVGRVGSLVMSLLGRAERMLAIQPAQVELEALGPVASEVHAARSELHALRSELGPLLAITPYLGWLPRYGADIEAAPALADMTIALVDAGDLILNSLQPGLAELPDGKMSIPAAVQIMRDLQPALNEARPHLERAVQARARIRRPLSPRLASLLTKADKALPAAVTAVDAASIAPELLGADGPRTYLILAQNSDELRPTGGFISSIGRVVVENGQIVSQGFEDSYAVDDYDFPYPDAPVELQTYMGSEIWVFRDSNWSPDFPTSAAQAIELYQIGRPGPVDGVIAINLRAIPTLFEGLGPLSVPGFEKPITGQTVITATRQALLPEPDERSTDWWDHRKDFMGSLAGAVMSRVQTGLTAAQASRLASAALETLDRRDLLIYLKSPQAQRVLAQRKWDGALVRATGDFVMVVDANMGFNKVNPKIEEQLEYTVQLDQAGSGRASLVTRHSSLVRPQPDCDPTPRYDKTYEGMMERCYWDMVRVYAPGGSALITATLQAPAPLVGQRFSDGQPTAAQELGYSVFGSFFVLNGGVRQATRFEYALPQVVEEEDGLLVYSLYVQRQPATNDLPIDIAVVLPAGAQLIKTDPPAQASGYMLSWSLSLSADRRVRAWYRLRQ
jgi:PAS domain-containing protein